MFMDIQYYPTGAALANRAAKLFKNRRFTRLLEPSAGQGHLLHPFLDSGKYWRCNIDCIEIDPANADVLRAKGLAVVHHDFLTFSNGAAYSHILLNPPFRNGVEHALKAWDVLFDGEIVAILNARCIEAPSTQKELLLSRLVEQHGDVTYLEEAFQSPDTMRKTSVRIALVHLTKESDFRMDFVEKLTRDRRRFQDFDESSDTKDLALHGMKISNLVTGFEAAVAAMRDHVMAGMVAARFADRVGQGVQPDEEQCSDENVTDYVRKLNDGYADLKSRAWRTVLNLTEVQGRLSSKAMKRLESDFETIAQLAFTRENIFGFLEGLIIQQSTLQAEMVCDVFDLFSRYHYTNAVYYQGWKSNTKHRQNAWKVKATRLIVPAVQRDRYSCNFIGTSLGWEDARVFSDIDRVFAMLDGQHHDAVYGLEALANKQFAGLRGGERLASEYFDLRLYKGTGTWHIFPRRQDLVDRFNRVVGRHRAWMPEDERSAGPAFWEQYEAAEEVAAVFKLTDEEHAILRRRPDEVDRIKVLIGRFDEALEAKGVCGSPALFVTELGPEREQEPRLPCLGGSHVA